MKKLMYLTIALGVVCIGLFSGCNKQSSAPAAAPEVTTNAPATTNAP